MLGEDDAPDRGGLRYYDDRMDESRCAPPEKRNRAKSGGLCGARRERGGLGDFPVCIPDGAARGGGAGADLARRGTFERGTADVDRNDCGDRGGGGRGAFLL